VSDNPFAEPDDSDRTIVRPSPGGRRPPQAATTPAPVPAPAQAAPVGADVAGLDVGTSPLTTAAAPLLQLLARLRNTARPPDAGDLRERAVRAMQVFERRARESGVPMEQLRPAHYALCTSIDDVVMATPWGSTGAWQARSLLSTFHQETYGGERFFEILTQLRQHPGTYLSVLELMYLCMSLGFMGRYRLSPRGVGGIDALREETYALIVRARAAQAEPELSPRWRGVSAPYRRSRGTIPIWAAGVTALACVIGLFVWSSLRLNAASDDLYARMLAVPPDHMPAIARSAPPQPVAPPPPPAPNAPPPEPDALDKLRTFLKPEIDANLVVVLGTPDTPIVRIVGRGMFPSGSASLQPSFMPLLERIGRALNDEQGSVRVVGYTDDQPIRTVRFPSNYALSSARADAARDVIARVLSDANRITSEGRAEANPIAPNTTPEGREQNRRIEVVLQRGR
jgi:type VI secretion system protein ImpK